MPEVTVALNAEATAKTLRKYKNYPVVEALCELIFEGSEWDEAMVGQFYDRVKDKFPVRRQLKRGKAEIHFAGDEPTTGVRPLAPQMQFLNEAGSAMIQLRQDLVVINQLKPYPHFAEWEPNIYLALRHYWELTKPQGIRRIGLRYINRIVIPEAPLRMEHYFNIYPQLPKTMKDEHGAFLIRVHLPCEQKGHSVLLTFSSAMADKPSETANMLDLYGILHAETLLSAEAVQKETQIAHENIGTVFEGSITDKLRALFGPES